MIKDEYKLEEDEGRWIKTERRWGKLNINWKKSDRRVEIEAKKTQNINYDITSNNNKESRILQNTKNREYYKIQRIQNITKYKKSRILQNTKNQE